MHHIETSQLICSANQLTGFYMMGTLVVKRLTFSRCFLFFIASLYTFKKLQIHKFIIVCFWLNVVNWSIKKSLDSGPTAYQYLPWLYSLMHQVKCLLNQKIYSKSTNSRPNTHHDVIFFKADLKQQNGSLENGTWLFHEI